MWKINNWFFSSVLYSSPFLLTATAWTSLIDGDNFIVTIFYAVITVLSAILAFRGHITKEIGGWWKAVFVFDCFAFVLFVLGMVGGFLKAL